MGKAHCLWPFSVLLLEDNLPFSKLWDWEQIFPPEMQTHGLLSAGNQVIFLSMTL